MDKDDRTIFILGKKVAAKRKSNLWSREDLAEKAELSLPQIGEIERKEIKAVYIETAGKLAKAFGMDSGEFIKEFVAPSKTKSPEKNKPSGITAAPFHFDVSGPLAITLTTKAALRGKTPLQLLTVLLNLPDDKLDRILPPGFRLPAERHGGMRIAAKDHEDDREGEDRPPKRTTGK